MPITPYGISRAALVGRSVGGCQLPRHRPSTRSAPSVPGVPGSFLSESAFQAVRVPRRSASQHRRDPAASLRISSQPSDIAPSKILGVNGLVALPPQVCEVLACALAGL